MELTILGGGLTGLVAAIEAAERGWRVTVHEASSTLGGRARTLEVEGPYRTNRGPHALYADGPLWAWLDQRNLLPPVVAPAGETIVRLAGQLQPPPVALGQAIAALPASAPVEQRFRSWLGHHIDNPQLVEAVIGLTFIVTYDHDPGRLSAAFVADLLRRGGQHVRYVQGGWGRLIELLAARAAELGVDVRCAARARTLPAAPTIVATTLSAARQLTGDPTLAWTGTRVALIDLGLRPTAPIGWFRLIDLDQRIYVARYSAADPTLAPPGHHLVQIAAALRPDDPFAAAGQRVYELLDAAVPGWTDHLAWRRAYELTDQTGAVDLPGATWGTARPCSDPPPSPWRPTRALRPVCSPRSPTTPSAPRWRHSATHASRDVETPGCGRQVASGDGNVEPGSSEGCLVVGRGVLVGGGDWTAVVGSGLAASASAAASGPGRRDVPGADGAGAARMSLVGRPAGVGRHVS